MCEKQFCKIREVFLDLTLAKTGSFPLKITHSHALPSDYMDTCSYSEHIEAKDGSVEV